MTDDDKTTNTISLATERKAREPDFSQERAALLGELRNVGVEEPERTAVVQCKMLIEWATFHAACMLDYHDIERSPEAIVRLVEIMVRCGIKEK